MLGPHTPGTLIVLVASILLGISTISTPILKSFYFLSVDIRSSISSVPLSGNIKLGLLGYCVQLGSQIVCSSPRLGYNLNPDSLSVSLPPSFSLGSGNWVIEALTYALILHPIAAGLAFLSAIAGIVSHIREYSTSSYASFLSSLATATALLAFALDIIAFSIARNRINASSNSSVAINSQLGNAIWITLAAWACLACSGCFFFAGRRLVLRRQREQAQANFLRPQTDHDYSNQMRLEADQAEKAREEGFILKPSNSSLPAFAEYVNEHNNQERIPLTSYPSPDDERYLDPERTTHGPDRTPERHLYPTKPYSQDSFTGVGVGHPRRPRQQQQPQPQLTHTASVMSHRTAYSQASSYHAPPNTFIPPVPPVNPLIQHPNPIASESLGVDNNNNHHYHHTSDEFALFPNPNNTTSRSSSWVSTRRHPPSLTPAGGGTHTPPSSSQVPPMPLVGAYDPGQSQYPGAPTTPQPIIQMMPSALTYDSGQNAYQKNFPEHSSPSPPGAQMMPSAILYESNQNGYHASSPSSQTTARPLVYPSYHRRNDSSPKVPPPSATPERRRSPNFNPTYSLPNPPARQPTQSDLDSMYDGHRISYSLEQTDGSPHHPATMPDTLEQSRHADPYTQPNNPMPPVLFTEPDELYGVPPPHQDNPSHPHHQSISHTLISSATSNVDYALQQQFYSHYMISPQTELDEHNLYRQVKPDSSNPPHLTASSSVSSAEAVDPISPKRDLPQPPMLSSPPFPYSPSTSSNYNESNYFSITKRADSRLKGPRSPTK